MKLKDLVKKEVFVVCGDEDEDRGEIFITNNWDDLLTHMKTLSPGIDSSTRVFHGIIYSAEFLPNSFNKENVYVIFQDPEDDQQGFVTEADTSSVSGVADDIASLVEGQAMNVFDADLTIDNVFLLYGYQLQTCMAVDEDEIDDQIIEACEEIVDEADEVARAIRAEREKEYYDRKNKEKGRN
jgi:hypothetical protein